MTEPGPQDADRRWGGEPIDPLGLALRAAPMSEAVDLARAHARLLRGTESTVAQLRGLLSTVMQARSRGEAP